MDERLKRTYSKEIIDSMDYLISESEKPHIYPLFCSLNFESLKCLSDDGNVSLPYYIHYKNYFFRIYEWWEADDIHIRIQMIKIIKII